MPEISKRVCWFCNEGGEELKVATHTYTAKDGENYDVCDKHAEWIKRVSPETKLLKIR